jgi:hypothetical protein
VYEVLVNLSIWNKGRRQTNRALSEVIERKVSAKVVARAKLTVLKQMDMANADFREEEVEAKRERQQERQRREEKRALRLDKL